MKGRENVLLTPPIPGPEMVTVLLLSTGGGAVAAFANAVVNARRAPETNRTGILIMMCSLTGISSFSAGCRELYGFGCNLINPSDSWAQQRSGLYSWSSGIGSWKSRSKFRELHNCIGLGWPRTALAAPIRCGAERCQIR